MANIVSDAVGIACLQAGEDVNISTHHFSSPIEITCRVLLMSQKQTSIFRIFQGSRKGCLTACDCCESKPLERRIAPYPRDQGSMDHFIGTFKKDVH